MKQIKLKSKTGIISFLMTLMIFIHPVLSKENEPIGKVTAVRGNVIAIGEDTSSRPLELKSPVFLKDTIKTRNGRIQMMFKDNTLITLGQNSDIQITNYLWEPGNTESKMETRVEEGSFRILGGAITRIAPNNFKTDSPSGTIGIRGSMYAGRVENASLFVVFQGGKGIYIQNPAGMVEITQPGFGTRVKDLTQVPEEPRKITPMELQTLETTLAAAPLPKEEPETLSSGEGTEPTETQVNTMESDTTESEAADTKDLETDTPVAETDSDTAESPLVEDVPTVAETSGPEPVSNMTDSVSGVAQDVAQNAINNALTPTGTEQTIQFLLLGLGVTDITLSTGVQPGGIWKYNGVMQNISNPEEEKQQMKFIANWNNKRIIGFEADTSGPKSPGFAFGRIDPATGEILDVKVLGSGGEPSSNEIMALSGTQTFGHFYGANQEGLGLALNGNDYKVQDQSVSRPWSDVLAAKYDSPVNATYTASTSTPWEGFFIGVSENMADPKTNRRVFYNTASSGFTLSINKDAGTLNSGSISSETDFNGSGYWLSSLAIGTGTSNSVFITDEILAASIDSGTNTINSGGSTGPLKTYGNYMVTANEPMLSEYTTWGYWEIAYVDPVTTNNYHLHVPGSLWIAGEKTSPGAISALVATPPPIGTYTGGAKGIMIDGSNNMSELTNGQTSLNINFASGASPALPSVSGTISFTGIVDATGTHTDMPTVLEVKRTTDITAPEFTATISGATTSYVNGAFYGTNAQAVGGNFSAKMPDNNQYHGIFAGNR